MAAAGQSLRPWRHPDRRCGWARCGSSDDPPPPRDADITVSSDHAESFEAVDPVQDAEDAVELSLRAADEQSPAPLRDGRTSRDQRQSVPPPAAPLWVSLWSNPISTSPPLQVSPAGVLPDGAHARGVSASSAIMMWVATPSVVSSCPGKYMVTLRTRPALAIPSAAADDATAAAAPAAESASTSSVDPADVPLIPEFDAVDEDGSPSEPKAQAIQMGFPPRAVRSSSVRLTSSYRKRPPMASSVGSGATASLDLGRTGGPSLDGTTAATAAAVREPTRHRKRVRVLTWPIVRPFTDAYGMSCADETAEPRNRAEA